MYEDAGFILLSTFGAIAALSSFAALIWAAVWDGRDERAFRLSGQGSSDVPSRRGADPAR